MTSTYVKQYSIIHIMVHVYQNTQVYAKCNVLSISLSSAFFGFIKCEKKSLHYFTRTMTQATTVHTSRIVVPLKSSAAHIQKQAIDGYVIKLLFTCAFKSFNLFCASPFWFPSCFSVAASVSSSL